MKKYVFSLLMALVLVACGPSRKDDPENAGTESIDDGPAGQTPAQVLDSSQTINDSTSSKKVAPKDSIKKD
jgi:hypothetical protein